MSKYQFNNEYNPEAIRAGKALDKKRTQTREKYVRTLVDPKKGGFFRGSGPDVLLPVNPDWVYKQYVDGGRVERENLEKMDTRVDRAKNYDFDSRYPATYQDKEDKYWATLERFTDENGIALGPDLDEKQAMGKVFVDDGYFEYMRRKWEKEEGEKFKSWVFTQMDISTPVKKEYWKKRCPEFFNELIAGLRNKLADNFKLDNIMLLGPQNEEEFEYVYEHLYRPDLYASALNPDKIYPLNYPTTQPFPQGDIRGGIGVSPAGSWYRKPNGLVNIKL